MLGQHLIRSGYKLSIITTYKTKSDLPTTTALCPVCGKFGFVRIAWIPSNYYPKFGSVKCTLLRGALGALAGDPTSEKYKEQVAYFRKIVRGYVKGDDIEYRGRSKKHLLPEDEYRETQNIKDKNSLIRVTYGIYPYLYIGHYDGEKYREQMKRYRNHEIKYMPNGRNWCKIPLSIKSRLSIKFYIVNDPIVGKYIRFYINKNVNVNQPCTTVSRKSLSSTSILS